MSNNEKERSAAGDEWFDVLGMTEPLRLKGGSAAGSSRYAEVLESADPNPSPEDIRRAEELARLHRWDLLRLVASG